MDADRYGSPRGLNPGALALALGGTGLFLFGLSLTAPNFIKIPETILKVESIDLPPTPRPKDPPKPEPLQRTVKPIDAPRPDPVALTKSVVDLAPGADTGKRVDVAPNPGEMVGTGAGTLPVPPVHVPVEFGAKLDQRYAAAFQPDYPAGERTAEHEGRVVVRVLIGTDGRVKQVEQVSAPSRAFFEATRKRALAQWRFRPATRDGIPYETWQQIGVMFQLETE